MNGPFCGYAIRVFRLLSSHSRLLRARGKDGGVVRRAYPSIHYRLPYTLHPQYFTECVLVDA